MIARFDTLEPSDVTALVCVDDPSSQPVIIDQLDRLGLKIHTGLSREDIELRLQSYYFDVLVVSEQFAEPEFDAVPIIEFCCTLTPERRRKMMIVLCGPGYMTEDGTQAFVKHVDLVVATVDTGELAAIVRRSLEMHAEEYRMFLECAKEAACL